MTLLHKLVHIMSPGAYRAFGHKTVQNLLQKHIIKKTRRGIFNRTVSSSSEAYDPYEVLGVERGVSADEIKEAYQRLSKQYHPDFNPGCEKSREKFVRINNAYRKIMERYDTKEDSDEDSDHEPVKKYDFTISPLGIETEPPKVQNPRRALRRFFFLTCLLLLVQQLRSWNLLDVRQKMKDTLFPQPTPEQIREMVQLDIIKTHKENKVIEEYRRSLSRSN